MNTNNNQHYLVVTGLGRNHIGILEAFTKLSKQCGSNILESKTTIMGAECTLCFHLAGTWSAIAKLEAMLPSFAEQFNFTLQSKRTSPSLNTHTLPYQVQVTAHDRAGILNEIARFFTEYGIHIDKMDGETYLTKNNTQIANLAFVINIPIKQHLATLREHFMVYCEDRNLDAIIEPCR